MFLKEKEYMDRITPEEGEEITVAYRRMAASLLRYIRGGGDIDQLRRAVLEAGRVTDLTRNTMNGTMEVFLRPLKRWQVPMPEMNQPAIESTYTHMASGALQYVASRLDGDSGFQQRGEREMGDAASAYRQGRAEQTSKPKFELPKQPKKSVPERARETDCRYVSVCALSPVVVG